MAEKREAEPRVSLRTVPSSEELSLPKCQSSFIESTAIHCLHLARLAELRVTSMLQHHLPGNSSQHSDAYRATSQGVLCPLNLFPTRHL